jgi:hypothetical protein
VGAETGPILSRPRLGALLIVLAVAVSSSAGIASASGLRPLALGFSDELFVNPNAYVRQTWLDRSVSLGAEVLRLDAGWPASRRPRHPTDPADPAYDFTQLDAAVRDTTARGLAPMLSFTGAPRWAEGRGRPPHASPGTWMPKPSAVGAYGHALAQRYDGQYPDPLHPGAFLPRVTRFQLWNEPNLSGYLSPQWKHVKRSWVPVGPQHYRAMLNAFYAAVKAAQPGATVVTAGTSPFGDFGHGARMMPLLFWRNVLAAPTSFDAIAHQPYSVGAPATKALNANDISIPDIHKLTKLVRGAEHRGTALPHHYHHPIWITEAGYNTKPPNPKGVPVATDARWVEQALYLLWKQGVSVITWYLIRDQPPSPTYFTSSESGMYYFNGRAKPAATAFRFPVVGVRARSGRVSVWIRSPAAGDLRVQARAGGSWRTVAMLHATPGEVFHIAAPRGARGLRATIANLKSLTWTLR